MARNIYGVFMAAGSGTRMGSQIPKQFILLDGRPVLQIAISRFLAAVSDLKVITVLPREHLQTWKDLCAAYSFDCPQTLVSGGMTRFHSVQNALHKVPDGAIVFVHDGVRPLVSGTLISKMVEKMSSCRALIPVLPITDTLRSAIPGVPDPDRSKIVAVQTPQFFLSEDLKSAYRQAYDTSFTDDASVITRAGIPFSMTEGEKTNIKLTTPEDLLLAKSILALQESRK